MSSLDYFRFNKNQERPDLLTVISSPCSGSNYLLYLYPWPLSSRHPSPRPRETRGPSPGTTVSTSTSPLSPTSPAVGQDHSSWWRRRSSWQGTWWWSPKSCSWCSLGSGGSWVSVTGTLTSPVTWRVRWPTLSSPWSWSELCRRSQDCRMLTWPPQWSQNRLWDWCWALPVSTSGSSLWGPPATVTQGQRSTFLLRPASGDSSS